MADEKMFGTAREAMEGMITQGYEDLIVLDPTSVEYEKTIEAIKLAQIGLKTINGESTDTKEIDDKKDKKDQFWKWMDFGLKLTGTVVLPIASMILWGVIADRKDTRRMYAEIYNGLGDNKSYFSNEVPKYYRQIDDSVRKIMNNRV